ncbi:hypothetical protein ACEPAI_147 [Sanghuangporus weigelae]
MAHHPTTPSNASFGICPSPASALSFAAMQQQSPRDSYNMYAQFRMYSGSSSSSSGHGQGESVSKRSSMANLRKLWK